MKNSRSNNYNRDRLCRVEKKCNRILSELSAIRQLLSYRVVDVDSVIDRMHQNARQMKTEARRDAAFLRRLFHAQMMEQ